MLQTPKGTHLVTVDLKGKIYLPVAQRLVWFREERPTWSILTTVVNTDEQGSTVRAEIIDESGRVIARAHKTEHKTHFVDHLEKAETGSIGRALALCGYGTQFAEELDEGERIVDAPQEKRHANTNANAKPSHSDWLELRGLAASRGIPSTELRTALESRFGRPIAEITKSMFDEYRSELMSIKPSSQKGDNT